MYKLFSFAISFSAFLFPQQNLANSNNHSDNNSSISAPWTNFYGQNSELSRQKRLFEPISWTLSTILMLIFWNGFLAPFLQAQLSLKISVIGWFDDEGCARRMWKNRFRSFCKPTNEEIFVREFIHQINMQIFSNISAETVELIQYEYSRMLQVHEPPKSTANPHHSLSDRESLFLLLFKNRLLPYGLVEIPKSLLSDEDKNSQKLYGRFNAVWSKMPPEENCAKKLKEWMGRRDGKPMPDSVFHTLLRCECVRMQGDWTKADWPVTEETIKNCIELLELKKVFPESEHKENKIDENGYESEDEEFFDCLEPPPELKDGEEKMEIEKIENEIKEEKIEYEIKEEKFENEEFEKIIAEEKKMRKINAENERQRTKRTKLKNILYDFLKNFDEKRQLEFLQRLKQNLLALSEIGEMGAVERPSTNEHAVQAHSRTSTFLSPASSTDSASCSSQISFFSSRFNSPKGSYLEGEQNLALGEDLEEGKGEEDQCRANFEVYGKNCLIIWKREMNGGKMHLDMRREEFGIGGSEFYPRNFIALFETTFDVAKRQIEQKELLPNSPWIWEHVGKMQIPIIFRRIACRVYQFAKEEEKERKKEKSNFFSKMPIYFGFKKKKKSGGLKMSKEVLNKFGELCAKFYERNLNERTELLAIEGFRELDEKGQRINEEIFKKMELANRHPEAENEERHSGKGKEEKSRQISPEELALGAKRQKTKSKIRQIGNRIIGRGKRSNNYYYENEIGIKSNGLIRRKRLALALPLLGFTLSLIFLQIYLRVHKKYDPITWLWMCMKYPRSWCKIPAAIQKEVSFIEKAKEIARQEMELKTVVAIRKLFEMYLPLLSKIKKLEQILMKPSKFLEKYLLKLNVRHQILLDCYFYDWNWNSKNAREKPENLDKYLVPIIKANKNDCTPFTEFMRKEMIPDGLKHILKHCSQIGGNV